jgi:hypothetical protein
LSRIPVVLFGACDRHNVGDLLFPHVAAALLPAAPLVVAGLAERDLRPWGGHAVVPLSRWLAQCRGAPAHLLHMGGETLTCPAWQAAVMLLPPDEAPATIAYFEAHPNERDAWVQRVLGTAAPAPYVVSRRACPNLVRVCHAGVGGVQLDAADAALRDEVLADLAAADAVGVRDTCTQAHLATAGIAARLMPDPVAMLAELFGTRIRAVARRGAVRRMRDAFPDGYLAVQISADFGDDATLRRLAAQLDRVAMRDRLGIVLFRAGAAPWHDDMAVLRRLASCMQAGAVQAFESLDAWEVCALVASSRGYCGSSLHGRIVAMAFALPRIGLRPPVAAADTGKQAAYAATWDTIGMPGVAAVDDLAAAMVQALSVGAAPRRDSARRQAADCRARFTAICRAMA